MADDPIGNLKASPESKEILAKIAAEVNAAYRENFDGMVRTLQDIAEGQKKLLTTLTLLVRAIEPKLLTDEVAKAAIAIAMPSERPDIATAIVLADPGAAGYVLSQAELANLIGLSAPDVSILSRAFGLDSDLAYAIKIPQGKRGVVKYREVAATRLRELIGAPPTPLSNVATSTLRRVREKLTKATPSK